MELLADLVVGVDNVDAFGCDNEVVVGCYELLVRYTDPCRLEFIRTAILLQNYYPLFGCHY